MKALMLLNSQNLQLTTSTLLNMKDIHLMNIFILMSLLKGAGMLTRAMAKELGATSAHECLFIVEQDFHRSNTSSSNLSSQNVAFVSTPSSTNDVNTSNVQQHPCEDESEEMDLKWQLALLSIKARKFYQRTGKKIIINGSDTAGYDKTKVECFNCHKMRHFARECRNPKSQENRSRNQDSSRRTVNMEESSSKAMLAIDGARFDWSFMTEEEVPTNFALKTFSDSELNKSEFDLANYKRGLAYVEEQLVFYKKNEGMLYDQIAVLKRDASFNESKVNALKIQIERLKKEKESNQIKIDNFENASKSLDKLIGSQISDNNRKRVGYNAVAPLPTGLFAPPTIDLSTSGLEEFKQPEFEGYGVKVKKSVSENSSNEIKKTTCAPIIKDWVSDCDEDETMEKVTESANVQKPKQPDQPRKVSKNPRNNSTNWNTPMSKKLGVGVQFTPKACFVCGSFNHLIKDCDFHDKKMVQKPVLNNVKKGTGQREVRPVWNNAMRTNHQNFSNSRRNFAPTAVLTKSGLVPISTARQSSSRVAASVSTVRPIKTDAPKSFVNVAKTRPNAFQKSHSPSRRPFYQQTALKNRNLNNKVNTVKVNSVNTAKGKRVTSVVGEQGINVVKSKACWVWRPKIKVLEHVSKNSGSYICKQFDYVDPTGRIKSVMAWVGDEAIHKELDYRMERAATTASSLEAEQDSDAQTRFEAASKSTMIHLSQEVTHLDVGRSGPISLNTARQSHFNAVRTNRVNAVKASTCWFWRPIKPNSASITLKRYDYVDGNPETKLEDSVRLNNPEDKKQSIDMSSAEAEYVAAAGCCANILWMKSQCTDYDIIYEKVPIFYDNTSAIAISNNPVLHLRTKHIDIRYHFIRDHILKGDIELHFIPTQYQLVDIFTKPLDEPTFKRLIVELGMLNIDSKPEASILTKKTEASAFSSKTEQTFIC
ncbi:ribonuclease H-like domain-containing protein [Tanacetum coccineum]